MQIRESCASAQLLKAEFIRNSLKFKFRSSNFIRGFVRLFIRLSVRPSFRPSIRPSACLAIHPSIHLSKCVQIIGWMDVWIFPPVSYKTPALWGRCPKSIGHQTLWYRGPKGQMDRQTDRPCLVL